MGSAMSSRWCTSWKRSSPMRARAAIACSTPTRRWFDTSRPSRCRSRSSPVSGKMVDTMLAHDGTAFAGSRCVITNCASGYAARIASRWKLWCGALNNQRCGGRSDSSSLITRRWYAYAAVASAARHHAWYPYTGHRVLLPVHRHAEQPGVLHRRVDLVEVHRLQLGAAARRSHARVAAGAGSVASPAGVGAGTAAPAPTGAGCGTAGRATACWRARWCRCAAAR